MSSTNKAVLATNEKDDSLQKKEGDNGQNNNQENQESEESASKDPVADAKLMSNPEEDTVAETNAVDNPKESNITTDASQSIEAGELPFVYPPPPPPEASDVESRFLSAADFTTNVSASTHAESALANSPAERRGSGFLLLAAEAYEAAERTQMRADAIRQVAMGLAAASSSSAQRAGITDPGLQQQYRDAILNTSSSPFLQGFASRDSSFGQQQSSMYSSAAAAEGTAPPPLPGVVGDDANFREQVYMAAARMQMQQAQEAQAKSSGRTQEAAKSSPKSSPKRKRLPTSSSKAKSSSHKKSGASPSLPKAPLVLPTKKAQGKAKCEEGDGILPSGKPKPVKHVYHDYSAVPDCEEFTRKKTGGVSMPFPEKLMDMLDKESVLHPDIISWCSHGRAFIVRKPKVFTSDIMGEYFKQSKLTSFQRQLNLYGFRRITQGPDASAYYHELFLRGRPQLCMRMHRQKVKGTGHKQPTDVSTEPNFYAMPKLEGGSEGESVAMEEVAVSVGAGDNTSMPSLFLLGQSNSNPPPPYAPPDGQLNAQYPLSYLNSPGIQAATMLRRLSASNVNAPPFSLSAGSTYQDTNTAGTTTFQPSAISESCALANAAASAMTSSGNDESEHGSVASKTYSTKEGTKMEYV